MTQYTCPNCRGGFPFPPENELDTGETPECPWCGQALDGTYKHRYGGGIVDAHTRSNEPTQVQD